jgi:predicted nucleic acid-binding Zn ribbon protein
LILRKLNYEFADRLTNKSSRALGNKLGDRLPRAVDTSAQEPLVEPLVKLLTDIKFSPARWQTQPENSAPVLAKHPSHLPPEITDRPTTGNWWQEIQDRSPHLPLCNQCHCPTPAGEIDRWGCCALCATKKWSR